MLRNFVVLGIIVLLSGCRGKTQREYDKVTELGPLHFQVKSAMLSAYLYVPDESTSDESDGTLFYNFEFDAEDSSFTAVGHRTTLEPDYKLQTTPIDHYPQENCRVTNDLTPEELDEVQNILQETKVCEYYFVPGVERSRTLIGRIGRREYLKGDVDGLYIYESDLMSGRHLYGCTRDATSRASQFLKEKFLASANQDCE